MRDGFRQVEVNAEEILDMLRAIANLRNRKQATSGADVPSICGKALRDLDPIHACYATDVLKVALHLMVPKVAGSITTVSCLSGLPPSIQLK